MIKQEEIDKLNLEDELVDSEEIDDLKDLKKESYKDSIKLGKLYLNIFNKLKELQEYTKNSQEIYDFIEKLKLEDNFRKDLEIYLSNQFGSYLSGQRIIKYVNQKKEDINNVVDLFFKMFKEEI